MTEQTPPIHLDEEGLKTIEEALEVLKTSNSPDILGVMDFINDEAVPAMIKWIRARQDSTMSDPEPHLTVAKREWDMAKDADNLQRSAWAELHAVWLIYRVVRLQETLKYVVESVHTWRHDIDVATIPGYSLRHGHDVLREGK